MATNRYLSIAIKRGGFLIFTLVTALAISHNTQATIFGLKSCGSSSTGFCGSGIIPNSLPPTNLFAFQEDGSGFLDIGSVTLGGNDINADALALSSTNELLAFNLQKSGSTVTGSTLISINSSTAEATTIGSTLSGRDIRGGVFDQSDALWVIDAANDEILGINSTTGTILSALGLSLGGNSYDLSDASDLAVRQDGTFFLTDISNSYTLDILSGALSLLNTDVGQGLSGAAFSNDASQDSLFAYEVNGFDDIYHYEVNSGFNRAILYANIIPSFNAGRGDLASMVTSVSEPSMLLLFLPTLIGLIVIRRKKWNQNIL